MLLSHRTRSREGIKFTSRWKRWYLDGKENFRMATIFSNDVIFLRRYAFNRSDVGRKTLSCILKDLWHTTRDLMVKYTDQPKIRPVLVLVRILVFIELKLPTELLGVDSKF